MLLTITTTHWPATDLGYLLHKNPAKVHSFELSFGKAHVFILRQAQKDVLPLCSWTSIRWGWCAARPDKEMAEPSINM
jgi:hypothetical protein